MEDTDAARAGPAVRPLPTDRATLLCAAAGAVLAYACYRVLVLAGAWTSTGVERRLGMTVFFGVVTGLVFGFRAAMGDRWFAFLGFGVPVWMSVSMYAYFGLLDGIPSASVSFLCTTPVVFAAGVAVGEWTARLVQR